MATQEILLTVVRILMGLLFIGHGAQKLFGWFGGKGMTGTVAMTEKMGFRPARLWALVSGLSEFLGGLSLTFGLLTPVGAAFLVGVMLTAIGTVHAANGLWNTGGGYEFPLVNFAVLVLIGMTDPGRLSVDHYLGLDWSPEKLFVVSVIVVLVGLVASGLTIARPATKPTNQVPQPR